MVAEVVHGAPCRFTDPARFSLRPWRQGRPPFPGAAAGLRPDDRRAEIRGPARQGSGAKRRSGRCKRLDDQARRIEGHASGPPIEEIIASERERSHSYGGRTVFGWAKPVYRQHEFASSAGAARRKTDCEGCGDVGAFFTPLTHPGLPRDRRYRAVVRLRPRRAGFASNPDRPFPHPASGSGRARHGRMRRLLCATVELRSRQVSSLATHRFTPTRFHNAIGTRRAGARASPTATRVVTTRSMPWGFDEHGEQRGDAAQPDDRAVLRRGRRAGRRAAVRSTA